MIITAPEPSHADMPLSLHSGSKVADLADQTLVVFFRAMLCR